MRKVFWYSFIGAFFGGVIANWVSPKMIGWYFDPPVNIGVNCREATEWAMARLQWAQFFGMCGGVLLGLLVYRAFGRKNPTKSV